MNSIQIETALNSEQMVRDIFVGVFAADELPKEKEYPGGYIANTDQSNQPGKHWVAFFCEKYGEIEVFDSYGYNPAVYSEYLKNWIGDDFIIQSTSKLQEHESTVCGQYCMFYILLRCHGFTYEDVISALTRNKKINDKFVCKFINKYYKLNTTVQDKKFLLSILLKKNE